MVPQNGQGFFEIMDTSRTITPDTVNEFPVRVWSDSDTEGITVSVRQIQPNSHLFRGIVSFSNPKSSDSSLFVQEGDSVTAEYTDGNGSTLTAVTMSPTFCLPIEYITPSNLRFTDYLGAPLTEPSVNQHIISHVDLKNITNDPQDFVCIFDVSKAGMNIFDSYISGTLAPNQILTPGFSWTPSLPNTYDIFIHVWRSIDNPSALSPTISAKLKVKVTKNTIMYSFERIFKKFSH